MKSPWLRHCHHSLVGLTILCVVLPAPAWAERVTLKNGMVLEGGVGEISTLKADPAKASTGSARQIVLVDDDLRRVFFGGNQLAATPVPSTTVGFERIKIPQRVAGGTLKQIVTVGPIVRVDPFDHYGRRIFTMLGPDGNIDLVQGITEITPTWTRLDALQLQGGINSYAWSTKIATSSIPRDTLSRILRNYLDVKNSDDRLRIVKLYVQANRISDAREELAGVLKDFPELAFLKEREQELVQTAANRIIKEIELRRAAGQPELAYAMLTSFPSEGVAGETLLKVRDMIAEMDGQQTQGATVIKLMKEHFDALADDKTRTEVQPVCEEIAAELSVHTLDRMADYLRLSTDPALSAEQKLSLAISGWLLGNGAGTDNLAVTRQLYKVRDLVRVYLASRLPAERDAVLEKLKGLEGGTPPYVAKLIANMKPPLDATAKVDAAPVAVLEDPKDLLGLRDKEDVKEAIKRIDDKLPEPKGAPAGKPVIPGKGKEVKAIPPAPPKAPVKPAAPAETTCDPKEQAPAAEEALILGPKEAKAKSEVPGAGAFGGKAPLPGAKEPKAGDAKPPLAPAKGEEKAATKEPAGEKAADQTNEPRPMLGNTGIPGLYLLEAKGPSEYPNIKYLVQLPPEYDPYRRYPVIVTLNGAGTSPIQQIDWWAGSFKQEANTRYGQATRYGYIVVAPVWQRDAQRKYEFSAGEHAAVLNPLREVCRRFGVDTDRVFLSGHSMGGDAAWDIGVSHPDLWAGVIPIVAEASKFIGRYPDNGALLPMYFICGERDGNKIAANAVEWDRYLRHSDAARWDVMVVQYQGRGHESYHDEIQDIFEWMNLSSHRRNFFPKNIGGTKEFPQSTPLQSLRTWDNFFWFAEFSGMPASSIIHPVEWTGEKPPKGTPLQVWGSINNDTDGNGVVRVSCGASKVSVWLSPEMVDFSKKITVYINAKKVSGPIAPNLVHLLEDARLRCDRQHPFWLRVSNRD